MATPPDFTSGAVLTAAQMNAVGMWLVKTQTIGSAVSSVAVTNAFTADYENYKIVINSGVGSTDSDLRFNFTGSTASYYYGRVIVSYSTGAVTGAGGNNLGYWITGYGSASSLAMNTEILSPQLAKVSAFSSAQPAINSLGSSAFLSGFHNVATAYTGFTITPSVGTLTGGTIRVYGYRN